MGRQTTTFYLNERPKGDIVKGQTFKSKTEEAPTADQLKDGQILVEALYLSLDPAMRGWLNDIRSYVPPVGIGEKMRGAAISRVLASKSSKAKEGDLVNAMVGWTEVGIVDEKTFEVVELPANCKVTDALGVLGLTGLTAYFGLAKIGNVQKGDTVVVSGAAGATGSVVGQIAKLKGARVVGLAGSDEKCDWLKSELGFDVALNYKSPSFSKDFEKATPDFINVYWDNVGGEILELALSRAAFRSRFVMCGSISGYNSPGKESKGIRNFFQVTAQRIRMEGFIVFDFLSEYEPARKELGQWLSEGKIKRKETVIPGGLKEVESAWEELFQGRNMGKLLLEVKPHQGNVGSKL
ncbi:putative NADP-dependent leukotriene B4 12-hydroxydehydrogenase [Seiridium cardinale]|uniref:NADP-dependent leukotriene B4 12-hydroxydehydrogenase n=1 Tax=Seiridium cardinale TaxID=138064 RepID=A0ABR2X770_9PEZI